MEKDKIFELRAETRTERSLGCQMTIAKEKFGRSAKPAARRGPKPVKNALKCVNYSTSKFLQIFDFKWSQRHPE